MKAPAAVPVSSIAVMFAAVLSLPLPASAQLYARPFTQPTAKNSPKHRYVEYFSTTAYKDGGNTDAHWVDGSGQLRAFPSGQLPPGPVTRVAQSLPIDSEEEPITHVRLRFFSTTEQLLRFQLSADGGGHWQDVVPDFSWQSLTVPGTDLVWRCTLTYLGDGVEPEVRVIGVDWQTRDPIVWKISPDGNGDAPTIQDAVDSADFQDTILLGPGIYAGPGNADVQAFSDVTIASQAGAQLTIIDCESVRPGFVFGTEVIVSQLTKQRSEASNRGWTYGTYSLSGVTIRNSNRFGVSAYDESVRLSDCVIEENASNGVYLEALGPSELRRNVIRENRLGIGSLWTSLTISDNEISDNQYSGIGVSEGSATIVNNRLVNDDIWMDLCNIGDIIGNEVTGGCITLTYSTASFRIERNTIRRAPRGGLCLYAAAADVVDNLIMRSEGAGVDAEYFEGTIRGNTIVANQGAGIRDTGSNLLIENCILAFNEGGVGETDDTAYELNCCDVFGNAGDEQPWIESGESNFSADPLFCNPKTGDFSLQSVSPCLPHQSECGLVGALGQGCEPLIADFKIHPGRLNASSRGPIRATIHGSTQLSVSDIDLTTVRLNGRVSPEPDGRPGGPKPKKTLLLDFSQRDLIEALGPEHNGESYRVTLTARMNDGTPLFASGEVRVNGIAANQVVSGDEPKGSPWGETSIAASPNPFNPATRIHFVTTSQARVAIDVFDVTGRRVERVLGGIVGAGLHSIEWNASGYPSGVYFARLKAGDHVVTQKLLLVK